MRHYLLTLLLLMATCAKTFALSDDFVKVDLTNATASQTTGNDPSFAIDGSKSNNQYSGWPDGKLNAPDGFASTNELTSGYNTWTIDFGTPQPVDAFSIQFQGDDINNSRAVDFNIEFLNSPDDETPAQIIQVRDNGLRIYECTFSNTMTYRYVRLNFLKAYNCGWGLKIYEVEFFRNLASIEGATAQVTADNTGSSTIVKGEASTLSLAIFDAAGKPVGTLTNFTLTSTDSDITIDGTTVTASTVGTYNLTATIGSTEIPVTLNVVTPISEMKNLVYNDGPWKAEVIKITPDGNENRHTPNNMVDNNPETDGGWSDGKLGANNAITEGDAWFTIDMKRACNISALQVINEDATIQGYTIEFYDNNPEEAGSNATMLLSFDYTTQNSANKSVEDIYLSKIVRGARYIKFLPTYIKTPGWGGRFRDIYFYGPDNDELVVDHIALSDNKFVVGQDKKVKVQALTAGGTIIYDNLDATFSIGEANAGNVTIGDTKDADGYTISGVKESIVPVTITAIDPNDNTKTFTGEADLIVASPLDQHVCLISHTNNKLAVAHQYNPQAPYVADNAIDGIQFHKDLPAGWAEKDLAKAEDGTLDQHLNWWAVDLTRTANVEAVRINWSNHPAKKYMIQLFPADVNLWTESGSNDNPAAVDDKAIYTQIVEVTDTLQLVRFDKVVEGAQRLRITMLEADGSANGIQFHEVCLLGRENPDFTIKSLALVRKDVNVGETRNYTIYGLTESGYTLGGLTGATLEIDEAEKDNYAGSITLSDDGKTITGVKKGITPIILRWGDITTNTFMEVTTKDWSKTVNIARKYSTIKPDQTDKHGFTLGNPLAKATAYGSEGAENESVNGLIDGDWMSWTITADEMKAETKPYVVLDLGCTFPVNEFNIHWNAAGDGEGNGTYLMQSGNYKVYGSTDGQNWGDPVYTVENRPYATYDVDRHVFKTGDYRYLKFEFTSPKTYGQTVAMNEITVGGPNFFNAEDSTYEDYPDSRVLQVTTPRFDRSNVNDRQIDNNWIVTSTNVSAGNPLTLSYLAVDCYGRSYLQEGQEVELYNVDTEEALPADGKKVHYRDIDWLTYPYTPATIGKETFSARITGAETQPTVEPLTVYAITDRGNVNRYSYAHDNAVNHKEGTREGDRDWAHLGTAPQNAADGNFGSWYAIGYYGDGNTMGQTYKFPANTVIAEHPDNLNKQPYELIMDYRGENYATSAKSHAERFLTELDMLGIQYEGAFARDYKVYILHCDKGGNVADDAEWEEVASFVNLQPMGVGVTETQRIYPANADGTPALDADGRIKPWTNVAAIKVQMLVTGTQWGIKMMESAIYGKLNKSIVPLAVNQARYATHAGYTATEPDETGAYYSFDLALSSPFVEADYQSTELDFLKKEIGKVKSYRIALEMHQLGETGLEKVAFTDNQLPTEVRYFDAAANEEKTVTGSIDTTEGDFIFTIPAVEYTDGEEIADVLINRVLIRDVNPSMTYRATATPLDVAGAQVKGVDVDKSLEATMLIPQSTYTANALNVKPIDEIIENRADLNGGEAMSLGSNAAEGGRKSYYHQVNAAMINGVFAPLNVTDRVSENWTIVYNTNLSIDGNAHNFVTVFDKYADGKKAEPATTGNMEANVLYVPLHTTVAKSDALVGEALADAPEHIRNIDLTVLDTEKTVDVLASNVVTFALGEKSATSFVASATEPTSLKQSEINWLFAAPQAQLEEKKVAPIGWVWNPAVSELPYDAIVSFGLTVPTTTAHKTIGFHATNNVHAAKVVAGENILHGGFPLHANDDLLGTNAAIEGYEETAHNFGHAAATTGKLGLRLSTVHEPTTKDAPLTEIDPIYTLITAEYPMALCPVEAGSESGKASVSSQAHPMLDVAANGAVTNYNGAAAAPEGDEAAPTHLQVIYGATAVKAEPTVDDLTAITDVTADRAGALTLYPNPAEVDVTVSADAPLGTVEIFTLGGARVSATDTDDSSVTINVSNLGSGVYIVRAAGSATRLIKK